MPSCRALRHHRSACRALWHHRSAFQGEGQRCRRRDGREEQAEGEVPEPRGPRARPCLLAEPVLTLCLFPRPFQVRSDSFIFLSPDRATEPSLAIGRVQPAVTFR